MSEVTAEAPANSWRHFTIQSPITSCRMTYDDLKRLFDLIDEKRKLEAREVLGTLQQQPTETTEQFEQRQNRVRDAMTTLVSITAPDGESVTGNSRDFFDSSSIPERIQSVQIDTGNAPKTRIGFSPNNRVSVFLDFKRAPLLNYGTFPSAPTPNESKYTIVATSDSWAASLNSRIQAYLTERKTRWGWLHKPGCYDALLLWTGLPLSLWLTFRLGPHLTTSQMPSALITGIYVYLFLLLVNLFRMFFSYSRWVFPVVEISTPRSSWPERHRFFWGAILMAVLGSFAYDLIRYLAQVH